MEDSFTVASMEEFLQDRNVKTSKHIDTFNISKNNTDTDSGNDTNKYINKINSSNNTTPNQKQQKLHTYTTLMKNIIN